MTNQPYKMLTAAAVLTVFMLTSTACGYAAKTKNKETSSILPNGTPAASYYEKSYYKDGNGTFWIPVKPAADSLGYRMKDDTSKGGYTKLGFSDVMYMLRPGSPQVFSMGEELALPEAPIRREGQIYMTPTALSKLFQTEVGWNPTTGEINIAVPTEDKTDDQSPHEAAKPIRIQSLSASDSQELVAYAKKFLGVPYDFGAGPYEETNKFDCSSFTRHVFKKFGVDLPRLAKDQDNLGRRVSRSNLGTGDLIFFTVPGRFESDAIPGHVGIYIGDGKFIHTWGEPGVQISELDSGYWSNVILHMQSIL
ncbi:C40 family peptidase [Paenibacillus donghaensis]|uniref:Cell wall hydrolase n=1 Tax=Paenibacillus donghaensis TaxID=414771 RepID=A0A2Z2KQD7_9BACL|nr:C40 family peptidase [Paenibacillus donghaensis]ASA21068.1 cell wall hydrolase [Paenibacillus donghaensis]